MRKWQDANRERVREGNRRWGRANLEYKRIANIARRARDLAAPGKHTLAEWRALVKAHDGRCFYCGVTAKMTHEHVEALTTGGSNAISNIAPACGPCNFSKRNVDVKVWLLRRVAAGLPVTEIAMELIR